MNTQQMTICLWFNNQAEEAARFYASVFEDSEIGQISRFGKEGHEYHGMPEGTAMSVDFRLNQMQFIALNGNKDSIFNESVSIMIQCDSQMEIDHYWTRLSEGGNRSEGCQVHDYPCCMPDKSGSIPLYRFSLTDQEKPISRPG